MNYDLSYLSCPLPEDIERLVYFGDYARAEKIIRQRIASDKTPEVLKKRLDYQLRIIADFPKVYIYSEEDMFRILSDAIRDFTPDEMQEYRDEGALDWIYIQGKVFYKNNALASLIKTHKELDDRLVDQSAVELKNQNGRDLNAIIGKMKQKGHVHLRYRLKSTLTVEEKAQRPGEKIRVHMILPITSAQSTAGEVRTLPVAKYLSAEDHPQRTAYFEEIYQPGMTFTTETVYDIDAPYVDPKPENVSDEQPHFDTEELLPQIRFTPFIRALVDELKGTETNPLIIARRFYDYVTTNTCYRFVPPYFTKTNIPEYFGIGQRGDCGMHALLFITLCRCAGIPAQWQAGLYTKPGDVGCHDWARFYVAPYGWLYVDGSFGGAAYRAGDLDRWNFYFGNLEPWRLVANTALQQEFDPPKTHLRSDPYDNQTGEAEYSDRSLTHDEFDTTWELLSVEEIED